MSLIVGIPPAIANLVQTGLLERAFHDALVPNLLFRAEASYEEWPANTGQEIFMTRPGLLTPRTRPLQAGVDPTPQTLSYEQWAARLERYGDTIDTHMPTSAVSNADQFNRNIHQLGIQAGMSVNRTARNALFRNYLSGQTNTILAALAGDTSIRVAALNGFTDVIIPGTSARPQPVSPVSPLPVTITGVAGTRNVIGYAPDNIDDPYGPGTLLLDAALGVPLPIRSPVVSTYAPRVIRVGGGSSVDAIGPGDVLTLQDFINGVNWLRKNNVQPHEDGYFHAHISTEANGQVFTDPAWQRLNTALPNHVYYQEAFLGTIAGFASFLNNEAPDYTNSGARTATGALSFYSEDLGAETVNAAGIPIGRVIITGRGSVYEKGLDESAYVSEAGVTGRIGEFEIVNNSLQILTERIRLIVRAPLNRLQDLVSSTWSISTSFPVPSDQTSGGSQRFKRAVVLEHALS